MRTSRILLTVVCTLLQVAVSRAQTPSVSFPPFDSAACVAKSQRILIIDMKSGWWSGDGEDFHDLLLPRIVKDCEKIEVEYYFLQYIDPAMLPGPPVPGQPLGVVGFLSFYPAKPGVDNGGLMVEANFPSRPWNDYQQVWVLSGGDHDPSDVPTGSEFFQNLLTKFRTPAAPPSAAQPSIFLGAGLGHHDHGNHVLRTLEMPELFQSHVTELMTPRPGDGSQVEVFSRARSGNELTAHPLFDGVTSIADRIDIAGTKCDTDFLPTANNPFQILGRNRLGEPAIAVRETETRRWAIDAGVSRYYSLFEPTERDTYRFLQNTIKWLAR